MNIAEMMGCGDEPEDWREVNDGHFTVAFMLVWNELGDVAFTWRVTRLTDAKRMSVWEYGLRTVAKLGPAVAPFLRGQLEQHSREHIRQAVLLQLRQLAEQHRLYELVDGVTAADYTNELPARRST